MDQARWPEWYCTLELAIKISGYHPPPVIFFPSCIKDQIYVTLLPIIMNEIQQQITNLPKLVYRLDISVVSQRDPT